MRHKLLLSITAPLAMVLAACGGRGHLGIFSINFIVPPPETAPQYPISCYPGARVASWLPDGQLTLVATDGRLAGAVSLSWAPDAAAAGYEVFRKSARADAQWQPIGETAGTTYLDSPLPNYKLFFYRVHAVGTAGVSGLSNVDSGFAGGGEYPCEIGGDVRFPGGTGVPGVRVALVGMGDEAMRLTGADGRFLFGELPPGRYIVAPIHPGLDFPPPYIKVDLGTIRQAEVHFTALHDMPLRRLSGFVFQYVDDGTGEPQFTPLAGVTVEAMAARGAGAPFSTVTNEDGFYDIENLRLGAYRTQAFCASCVFMPTSADAIVDGRNRPGRRDIIGRPISHPRGFPVGPARSRR